MRKCKRKLDERTQEEKRATNVATYGDNCKHERDFALLLTAEADRLYTSNPHFILNDGTTADSALQWSDDTDKLLPLQLKTSTCRGNFGSVRGYPRFIVVCWVWELNKGSVFDGKTLDDRSSSFLYVGAGGNRNTCLALSGPEPLAIGELLAFLIQIAPGYKHYTFAELSWQLSSSSMFLSRCAVHLYQQNVDGSTTFPSEQNGSYKLIGADGSRIQIRTARRTSTHGSFIVGFAQNAGKVDGKPTTRGLQLGTFDIFAAVFMDWETHACHIWTFTEADLLAHDMFPTEAIKGRKLFTVCTNIESCSECCLYPSAWTVSHYNVRGKSMVFPPEADTFGREFFESFVPAPTRARSSVVWRERIIL